MKPNRRNPLFSNFFRSNTLTTAIVVSLGSSAVHAASSSWNVNAAGNWATAGSWAGSVIPGSTTIDNTDVATFSFTLTAARTATVDATRYIGGISFGNTSAFGYTLSGGTLRLNNGGVIQTLAANGNHTDTISTPIQISGTTAAAATFTAGATSATSLLSIGAVTGSATTGNTTTLTLNGTNTGANVITGIIGNGAGGGSLALDKSAAGTWVLSGANTFTGAVNVSGGGTLRVQNSTGLGAGTVVNVAVGAAAAGQGTTLDIRNTITVASGKTLTLNSNTTGDLRTTLLNGANNNSWNSNIVAAGTGLVQINAASGTTLTVGGGVTSTGGAGTGTLFTRGAGNVIYNGLINLGTDRVFSKTEGGTVIVNSTGNSWVSTRAADGQIQIGANNALPNVDFTFGQTSTTSGRLELNGFSQTVAGLRTDVGGGTNHILRNSNPAAPSTLNWVTPAATIDKLTNVQIQGTSTGYGALNLVSNNLGRTEFENGLFAADSLTVNSGTVAFTGTTNRILAGSIAGAAAATIDKDGPATLVADGAWNNLGTTNLNGGILALGNGTSGTLNVATGGTLVAGNGGGVLNLTNLNFAAGATNYAPILGAPSLTAPISSNTINADNTVTVTPLGGVGVGTHALLSYNTLGGAGFGAFSLGPVGSFPHMTAALQNTVPGRVDLIVIGVDSLVWSGATDSVWDVNTTENFLLASDGTTPAKFYTGDAVLFNSAPTNRTITGGAVTTGGLTFTNNAGSDYSIANPLTVIGNISKSGTGALTLSGANSINGAVTVNAGVLKIGSAGALTGSSSVTVASGATIDANGITPGVKYDQLIVSGAGFDGNGAVVNSSATGITNNNHFTNITLAGDTTWSSTGRYDVAAPTSFNGGSNTLTKVGAGDLWFNPLPGATVGNVIVNAGTFGIQTTNMLAATSTVTVNNGAFHNLFSTINVQHQVVLNDGGTFQSTSGTAVVNGTTTLNGTDTNRSLGGAGTLNIAGKITGTGGFNKIGAGTVQLQNATNDYAGDTKITAGTLSFSATGIIPATTNLIVDGGTFATGNLPRSVASLSGIGGIISGGNLLTSTQGTTTVWNGQLSGTTAQMSGIGSLTLGGIVDNNSAIAIVNSGTLILAKGNTATVNQTIHSVGGGGTASVTVNGGTLQLGGTYNNTVAPLGTGVNLAPVGINTATYVDQIYNGVGLTMTAGTFDLNGRQEAINGAAVAAGSTITNSAAGTTGKLFIGHQSAIATIAGAINDSGTGLMAIEKLGTNSLTLSGTSNFTGGLTQTLGTTIVSATGILGNTPITAAAGTFILDGTHGTGAIALNGTSTFAGTGTSGGVLTAATGTTVRVGTASGGTAATTLTLGGLNLGGGANLNLDFNATGTTVDKVITTASNGLTVNGANNLNVALSGAGWVTGTYPILTYGGAVQGAGANNATLVLSTPVGHGSVNVVDDTLGNVNLVVVSTANKWVGGVSGSETVWDTNNTLNWGAVDQKFLTGDTVVFDDTATNFAPNIAANQTPAGVTFDNTTAYTLTSTGAFGIAGTGGLIKKNTGTVTILSANTYTGATNVQAGTLIANYNTGVAQTVLAASSLVQVDAGATLKVVANDANIAFNNPLAGSGTIVIDPHLTAATAVREVNINSTGTTFTGTIRLSPTTGVDTGLGTFRTASQLTPAGIGAATIDVDAGAQAWINNGTFTNNFIISGHGFAELGGGTPVAASGLIAYTDATLKGGIGAIRMDGNAVITGNVTLDGTAKIMSYGATGTIAGSIGTTNATDMLVIGGGGSGTNIFLTGTNNVGANPLRDIFVNGGSTTAQGNLLIIGNNGTTGTLGTGAVILNGDGGSGNIRFDRSDGYTLAVGNTITSVGTNTVNTQLRLDSGGTGFNQNGVNINLGLGALQTGTAAGRLNSITNLDGNVTVGTINVGTGVTGSTLNILPGANILNSGNFFVGDQNNISAAVNQSGGSATVGTNLRIGHYLTNTSTYNISAGTLAVAVNSGLATSPSGGAEQNGGIYVGVDGTGILNQSGTSTVTTDWVVLDNRGDTVAGANMPDGIDRYNLSGGTLEIRGAYGIIQRNASTEFKFTGGTIKNVGTGVNAAITGLGTFALGTGGSGTPTFDTGDVTNLITVSRALTGDGGFVKTGAGTMVLSSDNTYTGATDVQAGMLMVNGSITGSSGITVASGASVGGIGTLNASTTISGTLAPGNSIGTLTASNDVTWNGGATPDPATDWKFELGVTNSDLLDITGGSSDFLKGSGNVFRFDFLNTGANNGTYTLVQWDSTAPLGGGTTGTNFQLANFSYTSLDTDLSRTGSFSFNGSSLQFTVIPEPSSLLLGGLGALALLRRRRSA